VLASWRVKLAGRSASSGGRLHPATNPVSTVNTQIRHHLVYIFSAKRIRNTAVSRSCSLY
jgi:hypothetical protein